MLGGRIDIGPIQKLLCCMGMLLLGSTLRTNNGSNVTGARCCVPTSSGAAGTIASHEGVGVVLREAQAATDILDRDCVP